jgi:hypothetical protein
MDSIEAAEREGPQRPETRRRVRLLRVVERLVVEDRL